MAPGYDISAAAALSCFHVFALQAPSRLTPPISPASPLHHFCISSASRLHLFQSRLHLPRQARGAFDVRWCRGGISERIFTPWQRQLVESGLHPVSV